VLGIEAKFSGRNDLLFHEKKFSGNSQFSIGNRFLHHGTLLFDTNLESLVRALTVGDEKIISKGIQSVRERVTNIKYFLNNPDMSAEEFKTNMLTIIGNEMQSITLTTEHINNITNLEKNKYLT
jgi:lipoate-protein ligase A